MTDATANNAARIEAGRWLFAQRCDFIAGAVSTEVMPDAGPPEIAFAGRSNVGKSSLVNSLTGRTTLARVSHTPGRTQQVNFFTLADDRMRLVDLPGYGYAKVSKQQLAGWTGLIKLYLKGRSTLRRVCLLIDSRHGIKDVDAEIMKMLDTAAVPYRIVLTKADEPKPAELADIIAQVTETARKHPAALPEPIVTSSRDKRGVEELRADLAELLAS
ncbi:ribosome biogenesis GTP-binding protein YihA/YsxC [Roseiterribacter gracilis]|uniref:Probable GTP-binding protein EngB n=1 Tax=Roseiterribacter gracilis TaxID=2812848 RepID=A0A8S8XDT9_9PROT|nr:putative GTP-binding protein EngB [Rhodospirillales bacterium TMPK1]